MTLIGYARVSTTDQNPALQLDALTAAGIPAELVYVEQASGAGADRPALAACLKALRPGDTLVVWKLDRLGRSVHHLVDLLDELRRRDVEFRSLTEAMDTATPAGRLLYHVIAALAAFERDLLRQRVTAGMAAARASGRRVGRPPKLTPARIRQIRLARAQTPPTPVAELAAILGVSRPTIYRALAATSTTPALATAA